MKDEKVCVKREEIPDTWEKMEKAVKELEIFISKPFEYSKWITNVSLAMLGFYIAVLIQIRSQNLILNKSIPLFIIVLTFISVIIGLIIRLKYEIILESSRLDNFLGVLAEFLTITKEKMEDKGAIFEKNDLDNLKIIKSASEVLTRKYEIPFKTIIVHLLSYLFFN
jgi:hypothetical protein